MKELENPCPFCDVQSAMKSDSHPYPSSSGDDGFTGLPGGRRVRKSDAMIRALGSLDELSAALGLVRTTLSGTAEAGQLESIQRDLLRLGAELATGRPPLNAPETVDLDTETRRLNERLPPLDGFILPGKNKASAFAHWARTVCRRAECEWVRVQDEQPERVTSMALATLNRLSSYLFALARSLEA